MFLSLLNGVAHRREFILTLGGAAATWPLAARAQQPTMPVIGFLNGTLPDGYTERLRAFRQGLKETGYVEGENVSIEYRWAENQIDRLPEMAAELVRRKVAVIVATGGHAPALAAKEATRTIPIVFTASEDPVKLGLVASLGRPGGNLTGINFFSGELVAKRMELLRELVPAAKRVAVLVNHANATNTETTLRDVQSAASAMGLQIQVLKARTSGEINVAFATFVQARPDAIFVSVDPFFWQPAGPNSPPGVIPQGPRDLWKPRHGRSRRTYELRKQRYGCESTDGRLCRSHPQGREARRLAGGAGDQVRAGHQRRDRQDARPHRTAYAALDRRRRDRIGLLSFVAPAQVWNWPICDLPP